MILKYIEMWILIIITLYIKVVDVCGRRGGKVTEIGETTHFYVLPLPPLYILKEFF